MSKMGTPSMGGILIIHSYHQSVSSRRVETLSQSEESLCLACAGFNGSRLENVKEKT